MSDTNPKDARMEAALYLLEDFLARQREQERRGITLEKLMENVDRVNDKMIVLQRATETVVTKQIEQGLRQDRHARKLRTLHLRLEGGNGGSVEASTGDDEPTTNPNLKFEEFAQAANTARELKKKWEAAEDERKKEAIWWRHTWAKVVGAVLLAAFVGACNETSHFLFNMVGKHP
jgi:hypothetical protein